VRGNPGKRPFPKHAPVVAPRLPKAPAHLSEPARAEWRRAGRQLKRAGLISDLDVAMFAAYCSAWGRLVEAEEKLARYGTVIETTRGFLMQSPYLQIANKAIEQIGRLGVEFGMSPSSRSRVKADKATAQDELTEFIQDRA